MDGTGFTLTLTAGAFRDIASGTKCRSSELTIGRFTFYFEVCADLDDGCNTQSRKVRLHINCSALMGPDISWDCLVQLNNVESAITNEIDINEVFDLKNPISFSNAKTNWSNNFASVADFVKLKKSDTIALNLTMVEVSERRLLMNNFKEDLDGVNSFEFIVGKEETKLYGNENFLKFHSPSICNSNKLPDVIPYQFFDLLELLYDRGCKITKENVSYVLRLANKFDIGKLLDRCEEFLLRSLSNKDEEWFHSVLEWSCRFELFILMFKTVKMFKSMEDYGIFMKSEHYKSLENKHKLMLNQQVLLELKA